jgi:hypothetical protein
MVFKMSRAQRRVSCYWCRNKRLKYNKLLQKLPGKLLKRSNETQSEGGTNFNTPTDIFLSQTGVWLFEPQTWDALLLLGCARGVTPSFPCLICRFKTVRPVVCVWAASQESGNDGHSCLLLQLVSAGVVVCPDCLRLSAVCVCVWDQATGAWNRPNLVVCVLLWTN